MEIVNKNVSDLISKGVEMILYKSLFRGWVEVTNEQKDKLVKHMRSGITGMSSFKKDEYIKSRFKIV